MVDGLLQGRPVDELVAFRLKWCNRDPKDQNFKYQWKNEEIWVAAM